MSHPTSGLVRHGNYPSSHQISFLFFFRSMMVLVIGLVISFASVLANSLPNKRNLIPIRMQAANWQGRIPSESSHEHNTGTSSWKPCGSIVYRRSLGKHASVGGRGYDASWDALKESLLFARTPPVPTKVPTKYIPFNQLALIG